MGAKLIKPSTSEAPIKTLQVCHLALVQSRDHALDTVLVRDKTEVVFKALRSFRVLQGQLRSRDKLLS
jgi:hypothetical protein